MPISSEMDTFITNCGRRCPGLFYRVRCRGTLIKNADVPNYFCKWHDRRISKAVLRSKIERNATWLVL